MLMSECVGDDDVCVIFVVVVPICLSVPNSNFLNYNNNDEKHCGFMKLPVGLLFVHCDEF